MSTKKERMYEQIVKHGLALIEFFDLPKSTDAIDLCKKLRRIEVKASRIAVDWCNNGDHGMFKGQAAFDHEKDRLYDSVMQILGGKERPEIFFNHDPRGYQFKITSTLMNRIVEAGIHQDWGGYGILAPDFREVQS